MPRRRAPTAKTPETKPGSEDSNSATAVLSPPEPIASQPAPEAAHTAPNEEPASFTSRVARSPRPGTTVPDPFGIASDLLAGVRLFESRRDRVMAVGFDAKPSPEVIARMKAADYRWNPRDQVWVMPVRPESARATRIEAERLFQEVSTMIRAEKGIESSPDIPF